MSAAAPVDAEDPVIAAARLGDREAWAELYRLHAGRLLVWLGTWSTGDLAVTADDVAAEAWLTAARRLPDFVGDRTDFGRWLFTIARKTVANLRRRSGRRATDAVDDRADGRGAMFGSVAGPEVDVPALAWIRQVLDLLPPRERQVIGCTEVVGLDTAATAEVLGMTQVAVRVARHRGLRRLRAVLPEPTAGSIASTPLLNV